MGRSPHLNAIEATAAGIRAANKLNDHNLSHKGFRVLLALYNACEDGRVITRSDLANRLETLGNSDTRAATWALFHYLKVRGFIQVVGIGRTGIVSPTLSGRNYVKTVEKVISRVRWNHL